VSRDEFHQIRVDGPSLWMIRGSSSFRCAASITILGLAGRGDAFNDDFDATVRSCAKT
jgi:hypothetical protein